MQYARELTPCIRAPLLEPFIVASSLPFASGLARFTSCELPKVAGLFSPDIFLEVAEALFFLPSPYRQLFRLDVLVRYLSRWLVVDLLLVDALAEKCAIVRAECGFA